MSQRLNLVPSSVKKQDVERQSYRWVAPIPFLKPSETEVMETDDNSHKVKVYIDQNSSEYIKPFWEGVNEDYLSYLILVQDTIRKKQIESRYSGYEIEVRAAEIELDELKRSKPSQEQWDLVTSTQKTADSSPSAATASTQFKKKKKQNPTLTDNKTNGQRWLAREKTLLDKKRNVKKSMSDTILEAFELYELLLCEEMRVSWYAIRDRVCYSPWRDSNRKLHNEHRGLSWDSLDLCHREWLLTVFDKDAAEKQREYM